MHKSLTVIVTLWLLLALPAPGMADTVYLVIDLSPSTAFTTNEAFAQRAGAWVEGELRDLPEGSTVHLQTLGDFGLKANIKRATVEITPRRSARRVARMTGEVVAGLPELIASGKLPQARSTYIISHLELESYTMDCTAEPTRIIVLSDGVESGEVDHRALAAGNAALPDPVPGSLQDCRLTMAAIGQMNGGNPVTARHLIKVWAAYAKTAGATFEPVPTF